MKVELWVVGKTNFDFVKEGVALYEKRMRRYLKFDIVTIPDIKNTKNQTAAQIKTKEGEKILGKLSNSDYLILLDENGKTFTSLKFAKFMNQLMVQSHQKIVFLIGGAYGFSDAVYKKAGTKISLSTMTFSHQIIRVIFMEQLYRSMTILKNEPYHHQ